jgi:DNA-binding GntR family transcriptional regulator
VRPRLSQEVRRQLLELIADGSLPASAQVFEVELARQLGVSRTPLHEAMASLEREGLVESLGRRGWRIASLQEADAREIYPVLAGLEPLVVTLGNSSILGATDELRSMADGLLSPGASAMERFGIEGEWHALLLSQCPNRTVVEMARPLIVRASRFERSCLRRGWSMTKGEIPSVTESLAKGDFRLAARFLEMHWRDRGESVVSFVRSVEPEPLPGAA